jgi:hypothetical protein
VSRNRARRRKLPLFTLNVAIVIAAGATLALILSAGFQQLVAGREQRSMEEVSAAVPLEILRVQVQNGCGVRGAAMAVASLLRSQPGIDVVQIGNAQGVEVERSIVLDRVGRPDHAARVARALGIEDVLLQRNTADDFELTVIVGYDGGRWDARGLEEAWDGGS